MTVSCACTCRSSGLAPYPFSITNVCSSLPRQPKLGKTLSVTITVQGFRLNPALKATDERASNIEKAFLLISDLAISIQP